MDLYDIAVARKLSGGGGGGSSDFNKAMVTVTNNHNGAPFSIVPIDPLSDEDKIIGLRFGFNGVDVASEFDYESGTSVTDTYYIYQDHNIAGFAASLADAGFYTVTGDAEVLSVEGVSFPIVRIYGDCTITIS